MKKTIMIILSILLLLSLCGCTIPDNDGSIIYNDTRYYFRPDDDVKYNFLGEKHQVKKVFDGLLRTLYCLDSDVDENILFENYDMGDNKFWIKENFLFPTESTIADFVNITYYDKEMCNIIKKTLDNLSFDDLFYEINDQLMLDNLFTIHPSKYQIIFVYGNIERVHWFVLYENNIYICRGEHNFDSGYFRYIPYWYGIKDEYNETIKESIDFN